MLSSSAWASAQTVSSSASNEAQRVRDTAQSNRATSTAAAAAAESVTADEPISFEEVLQSPDDVDLSFRFEKVKFNAKICGLL